MSRGRRVTLAFVLLCASLGASGCLPKDAVGRLAKLDMRRQLIDAEPIRSGAAEAARVGMSISGALLVLVSLHCGVKAMKQDVSLWSVAEEYAVGAVVMTVLLAAWVQGGSLYLSIVDAGLKLGDRFAPTGDPLQSSLMMASNKMGALAMQLAAGSGPTGVPALDVLTRLQEALGLLMATPMIAFVSGINTIALFVLRLVAQASYALLVSLYWMLGPLCTPWVALPQTRQVFYGWLKAFLAVSLWPLFFALLERCVLAIPMFSLCGFDQAGSPFDASSQLLMGEVVFAAMNMVAFMAYLGIPVLAYLVVGGIGKPFRGMW